MTVKATEGFLCNKQRYWLALYVGVSLAVSLVYRTMTSTSSQLVERVVISSLQDNVPFKLLLEIPECKKSPLNQIHAATMTSLILDTSSKQEALNNFKLCLSVFNQSLMSFKIPQIDPSIRQNLVPIYIYRYLLKVFPNWTNLEFQNIKSSAILSLAKMDSSDRNYEKIISNVKIAYLVLKYNEYHKSLTALETTKVTSELQQFRIPPSKNNTKSALVAFGCLAIFILVHSTANLLRRDGNG